MATTTESYASITEEPKHFRGWPNAAGFDVRYDEVVPRELEVSGDIPVWCAGVLYRNGLGPREIVTKNATTIKTNHWFDCLAQVHRFQILAPTAVHPRVRVVHNSRRTCDGIIEQIQRTGKRDGVTFGAQYDPCQTFFKKVQAFFTPSPKDTIDGVNVQVTLSPNMPGLSRIGTTQRKPHDPTKVATLINKTDSSSLQALDPETLEPIGVARQTALHPDLKGPMSGAHAKVCPRTGDVFNFNMDFGRTGCYRAFHVSAKTGKCSILATFPCTPAYLHSSYLTENHYIVCVWNSHFSAGGVSMLWTKNVMDAIQDFDDKKKATWFVIDRKPSSEGGRGLISMFETDPYFCFHTINAYEEQSASSPDQLDIIADCCAYDNLDVLHRFFMDNLRSDSEAAKAYSDPKYNNAKAYFKRFKLPDADDVSRKKATAANGTAKPKKAIAIASGDKGWAPELPSINHAIRGSKYLYCYGVVDTGKSTFFDGLVKYDVNGNKPLKVWSEHGQSAGEPIFIADPSADPTDPDQEDRGVLLVAVLDGLKERSYLMVLNAQDMTELGRATMVDGPAPVIGFGFHGAHVRDSKVLDGA